MLYPTNNSIYGTREEMQEQARKKNDEELDRLCNKCCLLIGWSVVFGFFVYDFYLIITH